MATAPATARGVVGLVTSAGRLVKLGVLDLPALPETANAPTLQGGAPITEFVSLEPGERVVTLTSLLPDSAGLALGTRNGIVKRIQPEVLNKDSWDLIRLDDGDAVVGGVETTGAHELVFVTSDAQLLHFPASVVRPQGRSGGGVAGIRLAPGATVTFFGGVDDGRGQRRRDRGRGRQRTARHRVRHRQGHARSPSIPGKGRGTGGVRCHRFLRGEDTILVAYVGPGPGRGWCCQRGAGRPARRAGPSRRLRHPGRSAHRERSPDRMTRCEPCAG